MRLEPVTVEEARRARERIAGGALRTPLVRLNADAASGELYLKLECLQPIGSFKVRGAGNALLSAPPEELARGRLRGLGRKHRQRAPRPDPPGRGARNLQVSD